MFKWLKIFNKYDLYTKSEDYVITEETKKYYDKLVEKFIPNNRLVL